MKVFDLAQELAPGSPQYPGDPPVTMQTVKNHTEDGYQLELFSAGSHAGTHVDLPRHLYPQGQTVDEVFVEAFLGRAIVLRGVGGIGKKELLALAHCEIVLLAGEGDFWLTEEGAEYLVGKVRGVGTQKASIDPLESIRLPVHRILLGAGIWIAENLNLAKSPPEFYYVGPPLLLKGAGAAWARPVGLVLPKDQAYRCSYKETLEG